MMRKAVVLIFISLVALPLSYLGMLYVSATSASYSISSVSFPQTTDLEVLLSRQLDIKLYLRIEGHGPLSVPIKSFHAQIYLEDVYVGNIQTSEPFSIPVSGASTVPLTFHLDLSSVSLSDIQRVIEAVSSHNGEVNIKFDGFVEPIILFFPITVPIKYNAYLLTISDAPKITSMDWDSTSGAVGESVTFHITVKNVFRGSSINGTLNVIVREDVASGPDVDVRVYQFPVELSPGESKTFSDSFIVYRKASTRGFFLKALWGTRVLAEQEDRYPPRLSIAKETLSLVNAYWTVGGKTVTSCEVGEEVTAHIIIKANKATVNGAIKVKILKDSPLLPDREVKVKTFIVSLNKDESRDFTLKFIPDEATGENLRGYFIEIEGDLSWIMPSTYPPRLRVNEASQAKGIPVIQSIWWTVNDQVVTEAKQGQTVKAHVQIKAAGGAVRGTVTIRIRKDLALLPDEDYVVQSFQLNLSKDQIIELTVTFSAEQKSGAAFKGYFIQVDFDSWGTKWTMTSSYPPRLKVD